MEKPIHQMSVTCCFGLYTRTFASHTDEGRMTDTDVSGSLCRLQLVHAAASIGLHTLLSWSSTHFIKSADPRQGKPAVTSP
jgi:hypothetical protein